MGPQDTNTVSIYLARPIDLMNALPQSHSLWKAVAAITDTNFLDLVVYQPASAFAVSNGAEMTPYIDDVNRMALGLSDAVIALLPDGVPTIGTTIEIQLALGQGKPVAVVTDISRSWVLAGMQQRGDIEMFDLSRGGAYAAAMWAKDQVYARRADQRGYKADASVLLVKQLVEGDAAQTTQVTPRRGYRDDAGFDLFVTEDTIIKPGEFVDIPCGVAVQFPDGVWGMITGRSSTLRDRGLLVAQGIIDHGYTGPLFAGVQNLTDRDVIVYAGDRVAQLILFPQVTETVGVAVVPELGVTERGARGFGSTGA